MHMTAPLIQLRIGLDFLNYLLQVGGFGITLKVIILKQLNSSLQLQ